MTKYGIAAIRVGGTLYTGAQATKLIDSLRAWASKNRQDHVVIVISVGSGAPGMVDDLVQIGDGLYDVRLDKHNKVVTSC